MTHILRKDQHFLMLIRCEYSTVRDSSFKHRIAAACIQSLGGERCLYTHVVEDFEDALITQVLAWYMHLELIAG